MSLKTIFRNSATAPAARKVGALLAVVGVVALLPAIAATWKTQFASRPAYAADTAPTAGGTTFTDEQKKALGAIIRDYLIKNPEIMIDMQNAYDEKAAKEQADKLQSFISQNGKSLYRGPNPSLAGNPNGDITVVEFFDFNCHFCKRGLADVQKLVQDDSKVRVVFSELPILSAGSEEAAKTALAAKRQGKYWEFHQAMLGSKGIANEDSSLRVAQSLGLDMAKIKADRDSDEVKNELEAMKALAQKIGVNGTPNFLVGNKSVNGAPDDLHDQLEALVTEFRKSGCSAC